MKLAIIDDDKDQIASLLKLLKNYPDIEIVGTAQQGNLGLKLLREQQVDAVFLDVEMPDVFGLDLISEIPADCHVILFTAHGQYLVDALRNKAFDFLQKPIVASELDIIITRLRAELSEDGVKQKKEVHHTDNEHFITFSNTEDFCMLRLCDIGVFCFNRSSRCWEALVAGRQYPVRLRRNVTSSCILGWSKSFMQVHQSYIINVSFLAEVSDNICHFLPPFDEIKYVRMGRFFRRKFMARFNSL